MISKLLAQLIKHKFIAGVLLLIIAGGVYWGYAKIFNDDSATRYVAAQVKNGTLLVSVFGSGQVSASNQVDIKPKTSGEITAVYVKLGQEVGTGAILAAIDASDAERAVRDAETSLETAKLELDKALEPLDELTLFQAENSLDQAKKSKQKAEDNIKKTHEDGFNAVVDAFLDLPTIMGGLENLLFGHAINNSQDNITWYANQTDYQSDERDKTIRYQNDVYVAYNKARLVYAKNFEDYKSVSRFSDEATVEQLINQTYETTQLIAEAIKTTDNYIDFVQDAMELRHISIPSAVSAQQSNISSYTGTINSNLSKLLSVQKTYKDSREAVVDADADIRERELSLAKTKEGPDDLDIRAKKIVIRQKEDALATAKQTLADHYVRAPFAGVVAKVNAKKGDSASAGTGIATLVTKQKIAEISLNEIDVARVKAGQKVTLIFDAIPDLTITGQVAEIDAVGTVSQGVVTYSVEIGFDTQDNRVKTSMSVSAAIIIEAKPNVLLAPNSAVKSQGGMNYVEVVEGGDINLALDANASGAILKNSPRRQQIEIGTASDDFTEITNGLNEGDVVVTRTIQSTSAQAAPAQQNSSLRIPGLNTGGGGGFRGAGGTGR